MTSGASAAHPDPRRRWRRIAVVVAAGALIAGMVGATPHSQAAGGTALAGDAPAEAGLLARVMPSGAASTSLTTFAERDLDAPLGTGPSSGDLLDSITTDLRASLEAADAGAPIPRELTTAGATQRGDADPLPPRCTAEPGEARHDVCMVGDRDGQRIAALFGSSHVMMWLPGLRRVAAQEGVRLLVYVKYGCAPFTFTMRRGTLPWVECQRWREWATTDVLSRRPDLLIAGSHTWVDIAGPSGGALHGRQFDDAWTGGVMGLLQQLAPLRASGGTVTVMGDTTRRRVDPGRCVSLRQGDFAGCEQHITTETLRLNDLTRSAAEAAGGTYYDPSELVCLDARCPVLAGGRFVFRDRLGHVSASHAEHVGPTVARGVGLSP